MKTLTAVRAAALAGASALAITHGVQAQPAGPDITLVCRMDDPPHRETTLEIWFHPAKVVADHIAAFNARIDDRAIRFWGDYSDPPGHADGTIDRMTGVYIIRNRSNDPRLSGIENTSTGRCSPAPSKPLF